MYTLALLLYLLLSPVDASKIISQSERKHIGRNVKTYGDVKPKYKTDSKTTRFCTWWFDSDGGMKCENIEADFAVTKDDLLRWNPSLKSSCGTLAGGVSYCVEANNEPKSPASSTIVATASVPPIQPRPTSSGNGVQTPRPFQPGMLSNCNKFHLRMDGQYCQDIATINGISLDDFYRWNPGVGNACEKFWKDVYVCVGVISSTPAPPTPSPTPSPTTTKPSNGIETPQPVQPGMTNNCKTFYLRKEDEFCGDIARIHGISLEDFYRWNSGVGSDCGKLWAKSYVCVAVI